MVVVVALLRDLLLDEIRSQKTRRAGAARGYIILSSCGHGPSELFEGEELCADFSTVSRVMSGLKGRVEADTAVGDGWKNRASVWMLRCPS